MTVMNQPSIYATHFWLVALFFAVQSTHASRSSTATPILTAINNGLHHDAVPRPTAPPPGFELRIRQQAALATCGFIEGASDSAVTCESGLNCAATGTFIGCCDVTDCRDIFTSCFDLLGGACDQSCQVNPQNLVCPTSLRYCAEYQYEGGSVGLGCAAIEGYTKTVLLSSVSGDPNVTAWTTPTSSGTSTIASSSSSPTSEPESSAGLSTGTTAGIAIGVTLSLVGAAILAWIFYRRKKAPEVATDSAETSQVKQDQPQPGPDRDSKALSELHAFPKSPISPTFDNIRAQPSPGPPHYSQHYDGQVVEMPDNARPMSYPTSELGSSRM